MPTIRKSIGEMNDKEWYGAMLTNVVLYTFVALVGFVCGRKTKHR